MTTSTHTELMLTGTPTEHRSLSVVIPVLNTLSDQELQQNFCECRILSRRAADSVSRLGERGLHNNGLLPWIGYVAVRVASDLLPRFSRGYSRWPNLSALITSRPAARWSMMHSWDRRS